MRSCPVGDALDARRLGVVGAAIDGAVRLDAVPDHRHELDGSTIWPFLAGVATTIGLVIAIFTPWGVTIGSVLLLVAFTGWFWPRGHHGRSPEHA